MHVPLVLAVYLEIRLAAAAQRQGIKKTTSTRNHIKPNHTKSGQQKRRHQAR